MSRLYTILLLLAALVLWGTGLARLEPHLESSALLKDALPAFAGIASLAALVAKGVLTSRMPLDERHMANDVITNPQVVGRHKALRRAPRRGGEGPLTDLGSGF